MVAFQNAQCSSSPLCFCTDRAQPSGLGILLARTTRSQAQDHKYNLPATSSGTEASPVERCLPSLFGDETNPRRLPAQQQFLDVRE